MLASALLGTDPPELPVSYLVHLAGLFEVNENRARVALSRMVASGEVTTDGAGRYRLSGHLLERQRRQVVSRSGQTRPWDGGWHLAVVITAGSPAEVRNRRRKHLAFARLAELREGVWMRPDNLDVVLADEMTGDVELLRARATADRTLAERMWPLQAWSDRAHELLDLLADRPPANWSDLAPGFELAAAVLRHLQADPLLPQALLPATWPGEALRAAYERWDRRYRQLLAAWSRSVHPVKVPPGG